MIIKSIRFGTVNFDESRIIRFEDGLLGFVDLKQFILVDNPQDADLPFKWLVSIDNPEIGFLVTDPGIFFKDYVFELNQSDREKLEIVSEEDVSVMTMLTVLDDVKQITTNLRGPLVINWKTFNGRQVILKNRKFHTKHYLFTQEGEAEPQKERFAEGSATETKLDSAAVNVEV